MDNPNKETTFSTGWHYLLTRAWLFPIRFCIQPWALMDEIKQAQRGLIEFWAAVLGGLLWGGLFGLILWKVTDEIQAVFIVAIAGAGAGAFSGAFSGFFSGFFSGTFAFAGAFIGVGAFVGVGAGSIAGSIAGIVVIAGTVVVVVAIVVAVVVTIVGATAPAIAGAISLFYLILIGITLHLSAIFFIEAMHFSLMNMSLLISLASCFFAINEFLKRITFPRQVDSIRIILWLLLFLMIVFFYFPALSLSQIPIHTIGVLVNLLVGGILGLFFFLEKSKNNSCVTNGTDKQNFYLGYYWSISLALGFAIWWVSPENKQFDQNLELLAYFLLAFAPIVTGLIFYPVIIFLHWQQAKQAQHLTINSLWIMRWQTFAYPLPFFNLFFKNYQQQHGIPKTISLIKTLQLKTLQIKSLANAVKYLAQQPAHALEFCGHIAISSSIDSTLPLSQTGKAGETITCLIKKNDKKEEEKKLSIYITSYPPKSNTSRLKFNEENDKNSFEEMRDKSLNERTTYALLCLKKCENFSQFDNVHTILTTLQQASQAKSIAELFTLKIIIPQKSPDWITPIWTCINDIYLILKTLQEAYPTLSSENARRQLIQQTSKELEKIDWSEQPEYWANIAIELRQQWLTILDKAAEQAKEWLRLEITIPPQALFTGTNQLSLQVYNPSSLLAQHIEINLNTTDGLHLISSTFKQRFLEEKSHCELLIPIETEHVGNYQLQGTLTAEDLEGYPVYYTINETLRIENQEQNLYQTIDHIPYEIGAGLSSDEIFIGRQTVLTELYKFWQRPQGQIAVRIVGQRRIGKTSILNKIHRDASKHCPLIPIFVSFQGIADEYDFLRETSREMASSLNIKVERFERDYARTDFKDFLSSTEVKNHLNDRRFLLLLDEADLMPQQGLGTLPGFLRDLMQQAKYPTLLLFCGTPNLLTMSEDYDSILFNTTQDFTISYLNESESKQLLQQPVQDQLQFDDVVLSHAYRLTHGQPLLIQSLGYRVIKYFNEYAEHNERNNIVSLRDLNNAADNLITEGSAAFTQSWADSDDTSRLILSTLAWATDEDDQNRLKRTLDGIMLDLAEFKFDIERTQVFYYLEELSKNEFLLNQGNTYQFSVPLYRRWILWRNPPEKLREAMGR